MMMSRFLLSLSLKPMIGEVVRVIHGQYGQDLHQVHSVDMFWIHDDDGCFMID